MQVKKRRVFYIAGFDPRGVAAYHRLFSEEAHKQAALCGYELQVGSRKRENPLYSTWKVERAVDGGKVETTFEFPHWDDIARRHWHGGYVRLYGIAFKVYWYWLIASDFLVNRIFRVSKWNFLTGIAPAIVLFLLPLLGILAGWGGYVADKAFAVQSAWLAPLLAVAGFSAIIVLAWWLERFFTLGWLLRTYAFVIEWSLGRVPELEERMTRVAERLASYVASSDDDEIVVVGHSVGANVAVSILVKAFSTDPALFTRHRPVSLLTLGGSIPMQALMPWSGAFREDLACLAAQDFPWVDVSASEDVASFASHNPVTASGVTVDGKPAQRPLVTSGAFREVLTPETYATASWDMFRMHFQYLMAGERERLNDYFSITTDVVPFRERFAEPGNG